MSDLETYEVFAVHYAHLATRLRRDNFITAPDPHDGVMPIDYFVWAIVNDSRTIVVDTGFGHEEAKKRGRELIRLPGEGLEMLGIDAGVVEDVIITHLHYDHAGTLSAFPRARFHVQDRELTYTTGRQMCHEPLRHAYTVDDVIDMVRCVYSGRVQFHDGDSEIAPGVTVHHIGGHTMGLQCVRVRTRRGWVVLASDGSHFYENMEAVSPFPIVYNLGDMIAGYERMRGLASTPGHIVPGHDPLVMARYPAPEAALEGAVARLDVAPS